MVTSCLPENHDFPFFFFFKFSNTWETGSYLWPQDFLRKIHPLFALLKSASRRPGDHHGAGVRPGPQVWPPALLPGQGWQGERKAGCTLEWTLAKIKAINSERGWIPAKPGHPLKLPNEPGGCKKEKKKGLTGRHKHWILMKSGFKSFSARFLDP